MRATVFKNHILDFSYGIFTLLVSLWCMFIMLNILYMSYTMVRVYFPN